ncbi:AAA family ATPase [Candidatus Phytoplasma pruni]|uniref:AAA family ATPase n=1 Tax=Candidatus Phytoplasma pruni TaxID=479893 RepID=A0A851HAW6_9MOLU|nr:AAA family ATPase [Candidatus Phytoplasma pruni]NWN46057.1 AAA family ATPase [Candidatus Phytoplasma pruni]
MSKIKNNFHFVIVISLLILAIMSQPFLLYGAVETAEYKVVRDSANKVDYYPQILEQLQESNEGTSFLLENPQNNKVYYNSKSMTNNTVTFDKAVDYNRNLLSNPAPLLVYFEGGTREDNIQDYRELINQTQEVNKIYLFKGKKGGSDVITLMNGPKTDPGHKVTTFDDIAGLDEAKDELKEIADYFNNKALYKDFGMKAPKGALLYGPPGTGKTILLEALAHESGVPYIIADGPEFVKQYVGAGHELLQKKFKEADKLAKESKKGCIIFIDEIDTIGTKRTSDSQASGIDHNKMVNTLLTLIDGMKSNDDVVVIGATNKDDLLDEALTRPGRLDRKIYVGLPDTKTKIKLYHLFLKKYKKTNQLEEGIDYSKLADKSTDFSGATIAKVVKEVGYNLIQQKLKEDTVAFIMDNYNHRLVLSHKDELTYGRIDDQTDFTDKTALSTYSTTDLDKIAEKIKKILYPEEIDYYVEYILTNQAEINPKDHKQILDGQKSVLEDDLNNKAVLETRDIKDLETVVQKMKTYIIKKNFKITEKALNESIDKHLFGRQALQRTYFEEEKKIVAINEAGHIITQMLQNPNLFYKSSITLSNNPSHHAYQGEYSEFKTQKQIFDKIIFHLSGKAAEEVVLGRVS